MNSIKRILLATVAILGVCPLLAQGTGVWTKQAPLPTGTTLQSVEMLSPTEAWAVGYGQVIIHTTDGGVTWKTVETGLIEQQFFVVRFLDQMHGWVGAKNTILYTNDGGLTWNQGAGVTGDVTGLAFVDLQNGFAAEGVSIIFRTRDGGQTWTQVQLPVAVTNIRFFDSQRGIATGSGFPCEIRQCGVFHTSDGGNTWTLQSGSTHGGFFISPTEGWNVYEKTAEHTVDGGSSWQPETVPANTWSYGNYFADNLHGWGVGAQQDIIHTSDGGNTWVAQSGGSGLSDAYPFWDVYFADPNHGIAVGTTLIFTTADGGQNWTNRVSGSSTITMDMAATDANHLWAAQTAGEVLHTTDGGNYWTRINARTAEEIVSGVSFANNQSGWVVTYQQSAFGGAILHSADGGNNWQQQYFTRQLFGVSALNANTAVAVGGTADEGVAVLRTTNGGATWTDLSRSVPALVLYAIRFVNSTTGWTVGQGVVVFKSTDGGATWIGQNSGVGWALTGVSFADANNGWAAGDGGTVIHTTNGGATWSVQNAGTGNNLRGVFAVSPTIAWVSGYNFMARTLDGGQTWTQEKVSGEQLDSFPALYFLDADNGWAGGFSGIYRRSTNAVSLSSLTLDPTKVVGGGTSTGTVTLSGPAPSGGAVVSLTSDNPQIATVPATVTVSAGQTTASFTVKTSAVSSATVVTITASYGGGKMSATLTVNPPDLVSFTLSPNQVKGGNSSTGTVKLNGPAPAGGVKMRVASNNPILGIVPYSVTVAEGNTTATFTVKTRVTTKTVNVVISVWTQTVLKRATLTVTP